MEAAAELECSVADRDKYKEKRDKERQKERAKVEKEKENDEGKNLTLIFFICSFVHWYIVSISESSFLQIDPPPSKKV